MADYPEFIANTFDCREEQEEILSQQSEKTRKHAWFGIFLLSTGLCYLLLRGYCKKRNR